MATALATRPRPLPQRPAPRRATVAAVLLVAAVLAVPAAGVGLAERADTPGHVMPTPSPRPGPAPSAP